MWILVIFLWTASHSCYVEIFIDLWELCFLEKFALIFYTFFSHLLVFWFCLWSDLSVITCVCVFLKFQNHLQFSSVGQSCLTLCDPMDCSTPGLPVHHQSWSSLRLTSIESVMLSSHLILCHPLLLLPLIPPSIRVFSNESTRMGWPKYWSFALASVLPKNTQDWSPLEWTGWISLQSMGLSRVSQHHSSNASIRLI